jgi:hypothetical protein
LAAIIRAAACAARPVSTIGPEAIDAVGVRLGAAADLPFPPALAAGAFAAAAAAGFAAAGLAALACGEDAAGGAAGAAADFFGVTCLAVSFAGGVAAAVGCGLFVFAMVPASFELALILAPTTEAPTTILKAEAR